MCVSAFTVGGDSFLSTVTHVWLHNGTALKGPHAFAAPSVVCVLGRDKKSAQNEERDRSSVINI